MGFSFQCHYRNRDTEPSKVPAHTKKPSRKGGRPPDSETNLQNSFKKGDDFLDAKDLGLSPMKLYFPCLAPMASMLSTAWRDTGLSTKLGVRPPFTWCRNQMYLT
jgi:hypothetical protein